MITGSGPDTVSGAAGRPEPTIMGGRAGPAAPALAAPPPAAPAPASAAPASAAPAPAAPAPAAPPPAALAPAPDLLGAPAPVAAGSNADGSGVGAPGRSDADPHADPEDLARALCLRLLTDRARTRQELAQALRRKGVPDDAAGAVLERFDDVGLIDDQAFADQWVRSRHAVRGLGRRALAVELRRKGVADEVAGEALAAVDDASEEQRARELVDRRLRSLRADTDEQRAVAGRKLVGMLARKGYGGGVAYRVVREALAAHGAELDELASEPPVD
ncbi:MAG: regulatory protein RecX [Pseudonocardia sp.]